MAFGQILGYIGMVTGAVIGGVIGSIFPGIGTVTGITIGASLGGMLGGIAGQVFYPELADLNLPPPPQPHEARAQVSTYGAPIPIVYESGRLAGNIIYMQDINQTVTRTSNRQDGVRYYEITSTYAATFAIAFCEGPVSGISRIWVNHKIFADFRDPAGEYYPAGSVALATANLATSVARNAVYFTTYLGTEAQTADPTLVSLLTDAETPAYRGIVYIVFIDFPIGEFSGLPLIEVEIGEQYVASNGCSEDFTGTDGAAMPYDIFVLGSNVGTSPTIQGNALQFTTQSQNEYNTNFQFLGEFDYYISFSLTHTGVNPSGWIYLGVNNTYALFFDWYDASSRDYYADTDDYTTTDMSGRLRFTRNSSNEIYCFVWNNSLSRWEWNGNVDGLFVASYVGAVYPDFGVQCWEDSTLTVDDFVTVSGCENTEPI